MNRLDYYISKELLCSLRITQPNKIDILWDDGNNKKKDYYNFKIVKCNQMKSRMGIKMLGEQEAQIQFHTLSKLIEIKWLLLCFGAGRADFLFFFNI